MRRGSDRSTPHNLSVRPKSDSSPRLPHVEAAAYLGVKPNTLQNWRASRRLDRRIPYCKVGSLVQYRLEDLDEFLARNTIDLT